MPQSERQIRGRSPRRQIYRSSLRVFSLLTLLALLAVTVAACAGVNDSGTHPEYIETQAAGQPAEGDGHGGEGEGEGDDHEGTPEPGGEATEPAGGEDLAAAGQEIATSNGCTGCHSIDGSDGVGPTWQGLYGSDVPLADGSTVTADDAYIAESIREPNAKIHEGYQSGLMPQAYGDWTDEQVNSVIAYIQTLE